MLSISLIKSLINDQMEFETASRQRLQLQIHLQYIPAREHLPVHVFILRVILLCDLFLGLLFRGRSDQFIRSHFLLEF